MNRAQKIYKKCFLITLIAFVIGYGLSISIFLSIESGTGNGGAFQAMGAIALLFITAIFTVPMSIVCTVIAIIKEDDLPETIIYRFWAPLLFSIPPIGFLVLSYIERLQLNI